MRKPAKYNTDCCRIASEVLANGEGLAAVCAELDISRTTLYDWRDMHPDFKDAIDRGLQKAQRAWEQMGREGITGQLEKFSPSPWIFTMKNRFRDDYKEDKQDNTNSNQALVEKLIDKLVE